MGPRDLRGRKAQRRARRLQGDRRGGHLHIGDVFLQTTLANLKANGGRIALSAYNPKTLEGYQIKGTATYTAEGTYVEKFKGEVESMFKGAATAKGALTVVPDEVIVTTPGADNKKVLV